VSPLLQSATARVVWSFHSSMDPTPPDGADAVWHGATNRGSASVNLLGGLSTANREPLERENFLDITVSHIQRLV